MTPLREITVNDVRFFNADDVERWHRDWTRLREYVDELEEENAALRAALDESRPLPGEAA